MKAIEVKIGNSLFYVGKVCPAKIEIDDKDYCNLYIINKNGPYKIGILYAEEVDTYSTGNTKELDVDGMPNNDYPRNPPVIKTKPVYENGIPLYIYCDKCNNRIDTKGKHKIKCPQCKTKNKVR